MTTRIILLIAALLLIPTRGHDGPVFARTRKTVEPVRSVKKAGARPPTRTARSYIVTAYCTTPRRTVLPATSRGGTCAADLRMHRVGERLLVGGRVYRVSGAHGKRGRVIDIWIPSKEKCLQFGRQRMRVEVVR